MTVRVWCDQVQHTIRRFRFYCQNGDCLCRNFLTKTVLAAQRFKRAGGLPRLNCQLYRNVAVAKLSVKVVLHCVAHQIGRAGNGQFFHQAGLVGADGLRTDAHLLSNFRDTIASNQKAQHCAFSGGQRVVQLLRGGQIMESNFLSDVRRNVPAIFRHLHDGLQQRIEITSFGDVTTGPSPQYAHGHLPIIVSG